MLLTKLHIPTPAKNLVPRRNLYDKLNEGLNRKLILVSAPAGYGKTTLLCDWLRQCKIPTAWLSVDHRDNDPFDFLTFMISGIQTIHQDIGVHSSELLKSPGTVTTDYILELLINDIISVKSDFLLVLDDLHTITSKEIYDILNILIERKPKHLKIAVLTRSDPPLLLSRLRSQNELVEIRSSDLSFTVQDIAELFNNKLKLGLRDEDLNIIKTKTEGWIAGLQLAAISLQKKENISEFIKEIAGYNKYIMDYLMEEVLNIQSEEIHDFLLNTSILEEMCGSLCDSVLHKNNCQLLLESLEKSNLFIVSLDNERKWFRYHHLFRDLLKQRLILTNKELMPELHNKAGMWFEANDMPLFAIEHALHAGNVKKGLELINEIIDQLLEASQYATILRFASLFNEQEILTNEKFGITYAWTLTIIGNLKKAEKYLKKLENKILKNEESQEAEKYLGRIYLTFNLISTYKGETEDAFKYSDLALRNINETDLVWNSFAYYLSAGTYILKFELDRCITSLSKGWYCAKKLNNSYLEIINPANIAYLLKLKGRYSEALKICDELFATFSSKSADKEFKLSLFSSFIYLTKGSILIEQGKIEEGFQMVLEGYNLSQKLVGISFKIYGVLIITETYFKIGEFNKALEIIENFGTDLNKNENHWLFVIANALYFKLLTIKKMEEADIIYDRIIKKDHNIFQSVFYNISIIRYLVAKRKFEEVFSLLNDLIPYLKKKEAFELLTEIQLLKVKTLYLKNKREEAKSVLLESIIRTQSEGFVRIYINEGEQIEELVKEISKEKISKISDSLDIISEDYINNLKTAFEIEGKRKNAQSNEDLSSRELEILKLISQKLSNNEICETLYISLSTVKTHVSNILLKLEAQNRIEATKIAKEKGLI